MKINFYKNIFVFIHKFTKNLDKTDIKSQLFNFQTSKTSISYKRKILFTIKLKKIKFIIF